MVGESGPEILQNVPRGANVISAEPTRQLLNAEPPQPIIAPDFGMKDSFEKSFGLLTSEVKTLIGLQQVNNEQQSNMTLTTGRGEIRVAMEPQMGGNL